MIPIRRRLYQSQHGFTPRQLFSALQGAWLEPTPGYIWQENTGLTPTTTGGQTIGRIADQSGGGNDATQATAANRPVLGRRYNLLTYSEDFSNAAWVKRGTATITTGKTAPNGTATAGLVENLGAITINDIYNSAPPYPAPGQAISPSVYVKKVSASGTLRLVNSNTSTNGNWYINLSLLSTGWELITKNHPAVTVISEFVSGTSTGILLATTTGPLSFYIWGADFRIASDVGKDPTYQRITTATDYDYGQYPAAVHDATDSLSVSLPNLGGGIYSASGSVYFATPQGMSALHNQSMGTSYTLPALSTDIYSWIVVPQRLSTVLEGRLERYMLRKAGLATPDYLTDDLGEILIDDIGDPLLAG